MADVLGIGGSSGSWAGRSCCGAGERSLRLTALALFAIILAACAGALMRRHGHSVAAVDDRSDPSRLARYRLALSAWLHGRGCAMLRAAPAVHQQVDRVPERVPIAWGKTTMPRRCLMLIVGFLLVGCGASDPPVPAAPAATAPATIHEQFVHALQSNDRQAILAVVGAIQFKDGLVDTWLQDAASLQRPSHFIGKFTGVRVLPPTAQGHGQTAISVWQHETGASCYRASLAQVDTTWQVIDWKSMGLGNCPKS